MIYLLNIISGPIGFTHLAASMVALITGLLVLLNTKGTRRHRVTGYIYACSMIVMNFTAFLIYELFGKFGIFHWFAIFSCLTLFAGLYPVIKKRGKNFIMKHFSFMYWSVIGLYCAFVAEIFTRLPIIILNATGKPSPFFFGMVAVAIGITMTTGAICFIKYKPIWAKQFDLT